MSPPTPLMFSLPPRDEKSLLFIWNRARPELEPEREVVLRNTLKHVSAKIAEDSSRGLVNKTASSGSLWHLVWPSGFELENNWSLSFVMYKKLALNLSLNPTSKVKQFKNYISEIAFHPKNLNWNVYSESIFGYKIMKTTFFINYWSVKI